MAVLDIFTEYLRDSLTYSVSMILIYLDIKSQ